MFNRLSNRMSKWAGITLIELLIAVAIVGILAAVALPSFLESIQRARRSDATGELLRLQDQQEIFFNTNRTYTAVLTQIGGLAGGQSPDGHYALAAAACAGANLATCVTITATAGGTQLDDSDCQTFALSSNGLKASTPQAPAVCWAR